MSFYFILFFLSCYVCVYVITQVLSSALVGECVAHFYLMDTGNSQPKSTTMKPFAAINSGATKFQDWWRDKTNGGVFI